MIDRPLWGGERIPRPPARPPPAHSLKSSRIFSSVGDVTLMPEGRRTGRRGGRGLFGVVVREDRVPGQPHKRDPPPSSSLTGQSGGTGAAKSSKGGLGQTMARSLPSHLLRRGALSHPSKAGVRRLRGRGKGGSRALKEKARSPRSLSGVMTPAIRARIMTVISWRSTRPGGRERARKEARGISPRRGEERRHDRRSSPWIPSLTIVVSIRRPKRLFDLRRPKAVVEEVPQLLLKQI